jgi:hypothetical protein
MRESFETPDGCIVAYAHRLGPQDKSGASKDPEPASRAARGAGRLRRAAAGEGPAVLLRVARGGYGPSRGRRRAEWRREPPKNRPMIPGE